MDYLRIGRATEITNRKDRLIYRAFEMLPGILAWTTLLSVVIFSFKAPIAMALFIIVFDTYWLIKSLYLSLYLKSGFQQVRDNIAAPWFERLENLDPKSYTLPSITSWQQLRHVIVLPTYKEKKEIIRATLNALLKSNYPKETMIIVLAQEERAGKEFNKDMAEFVAQEYGDKFLKVICVEHPADIAGELAGKGSNSTYAMKKVTKEYIDVEKIPYHNILVSVFDVDTIVMPEYFGRLSYVFLTTPNPLRASYQPVPFYLNNIWEAPAFARIAAFSTTFWQTIKQEQFESMITYSSHSMPFQPLVDVGFWQTNMVSEDSRIFWQCLLFYHGEYRVEPLYYPVSMDANLAHSFWQTMINIYKQHRRWGYGAENVPYFLSGFLRDRQMSFSRKLNYTFVMLEGIWSWSTNALILFMLGWLPIVVGGAAFNVTVLSFNLPYLTRIITTIALSGLITSATLSLSILPQRPSGYGKVKHAFMILQWIMFPVNSILFGALPALDAQTRLMFGKYMGFWVTPKERAETIAKSAKA